MKIIRKTYYAILAPVIITGAVVLFILDKLNVDVTPVMSYMQKETIQ